MSTEPTDNNPHLTRAQLSRMSEGAEVYDFFGTKWTRAAIRRRFSTRYMWIDETGETLRTDRLYEVLGPVTAEPEPRQKFKPYQCRPAQPAPTEPTEPKTETAKNLTIDQLIDLPIGAKVWDFYNQKWMKTPGYVWHNGKGTTTGTGDLHSDMGPIYPEPFVKHEMWAHAAHQMGGTLAEPAVEPAEPYTPEDPQRLTGEDLQLLPVGTWIHGDGAEASWEKITYPASIMGMWRRTADGDTILYSVRDLKDRAYKWGPYSVVTAQLEPEPECTCPRAQLGGHPRTSTHAAGCPWDLHHKLEKVQNLLDSLPFNLHHSVAQLAWLVAQPKPESPQPDPDAPPVGMYAVLVEVENKTGPSRAWKLRNPSGRLMSMPSFGDEMARQMEYQIPDLPPLTPAQRADNIIKGHGIAPQLAMDIRSEMQLCGLLWEPQSEDEVTVEIGGQKMTQAQYDAARFPLLNPASATTESGSNQ